MTTHLTSHGWGTLAVVCICVIAIEVAPCGSASAMHLLRIVGAPKDATKVKAGSLVDVL
jgi:hypothetical protein